jgi:hypothetical protein
MLDVRMMMQSKPQTRGSTLRNGIRHDAVVREIPSATAVLFRDEFGMTLPLRYTYLVALFISPGGFRDRVIGLAPSTEGTIKSRR